MKTQSWTKASSIFVAGILVAGAFALAGCGSSNNGNGGNVTTTTTTTTTGTSGPYEQAVLANVPQFYWLLDDTGNEFLDTMVSGNNLQYVTNDANLEQQGNSSPIDNDGNLTLNLFGNTGKPNFVPSEQQILAADVPTSFSIELWFQEAPANSGGRLFGFGSSNTGTSSKYDRAVYLDENGFIHFQINDSPSGFSTSDFVDVSAGAFSGICAEFNGGCADGIWHYVVATYDDVTGDLKLYVDGSLANTASAPNNIVTYPGYWRLGDDATGSTGTSGFQFNGSIGQIAIYDGVLTQTQVTGDYTAAGH